MAKIISDRSMRGHLMQGHSMQGRWMKGLVLGAGLALAACSGGGGGTGSASGTGGVHAQLVRVDFGRLADVYGLSVDDGTPTLFQKDVLIGPDIQDQRLPGDNRPDQDVDYDFVNSDPDTLQPRLLIPRPLGSPQFQRLFDALDVNTRAVTPLVFTPGASQTYSVVPRNGAVRLRFSSSLGVEDS